MIKLKALADESLSANAFFCVYDDGFFYSDM